MRILHLLLLVLLLDTIIWPVECLYVTNTVFSSDTTLGTGESNIYISGSTIAANKMMTINIGQMNHGMLTTSAKVFIFNSFAFPNATLLIVGMPDPLSTPNPVQLIISGCTFLSGSQLLFQTASFPKRSTIWVMSSRFVQSSSASAASIIVSQLDLLAHSAMKFFNNTFSISSPASSLVSGQFSALRFNTHGSIKDHATLQISNNTFTITGVYALTMIGIHFTTVPSVGSDQFALSGFSAVKILNNVFSIVATGGTGFGVLYEGSLSIVGSLWKHSGNSYQIYDCSSLHTGIFLTVGAGTTSILISSQSVFSVERETYGIFRQAASSCPGGLFRADVDMTLFTSSVMYLVSSLADLSLANNVVDPVFAFYFSSTVSNDGTSQFFIASNTAFFNSSSASNQNFLVLSTANDVYAGNNIVVGGKNLIGTTGGTSTVNYQYARCNTWNGAIVTSYDSTVMSTSTTVTTVVPCNQCNVGFDCFTGNTGAMDPNTCFCFCYNGKDSFCLPDVQPYDEPNVSSRTRSTSKTPTFAEKTKSISGTADTTLSMTNSHESKSISMARTMSFRSVSATITQSKSFDVSSTATMSITISKRTRSSMWTLTESDTSSFTVQAKSRSLSFTATRDSSTFVASFSETPSLSGPVASASITPSLSLSRLTPTSSKTPSPTFTPSVERSRSDTNEVSTTFTFSISPSASFSGTFDVSASGDSLSLTRTQSETPTSSLSTSRHTKTSEVTYSGTGSLSREMATFTTGSLTQALTNTMLLTLTRETDSISETKYETGSRSDTDDSPTRSRSYEQTLTVSATMESSKTQSQSGELTSTMSHILSPTVTTSQTSTFSRSNEPPSATLSLLPTPSRTTTVSLSTSISREKSTTRSSTESSSLSRSDEAKTKSVSLSSTSSRTTSYSETGNSWSQQHSFSVTETLSSDMSFSISKSLSVNRSLTRTPSRTTSSSPTGSFSPDPTSTKSGLTQALTLTVTQTSSATTEVTRSRSLSSTSTFSDVTPSSEKSLTRSTSVSKHSSSMEATVSQPMNSTTRSPTFSNTTTPSAGSVSPSDTSSPSDSQALSSSISPSATQERSTSRTATNNRVSRTPSRKHSHSLSVDASATNWMTSTDTETADQTLTGTLTLTPPKTETLTRSISPAEPAPDSLLAAVIRLYSVDNARNCSWVMVVTATIFFGVIVVEAFLAWRMRVGCGMKVKQSSWKKIPQWRSLMVHHAYISCFWPCHYQCMWAHSLICANHVLLALFLFYGMIALGFEGGVPLKQTLIIFVPLFIAHIPRPLFHYFFFRVTFDVEKLEDAWVDLCNNNGEYLASSVSSSSQLSSSSFDGQVKDATQQGGGGYNDAFSKFRVDPYSVDFSLESPRQSLHHGNNNASETKSAGWLAADMDEAAWGGHRSGSVEMLAAPDAEFGDFDEIDVDALIRENYYKSFKKPQGEEHVAAEEENSDDDADNGGANDEKSRLRMKRRSQQEEDEDIARRVDEAIRANLEGRNPSVDDDHSATGAGAKRILSSSVGGGGVKRMSNHQLDPTVVREVEESLAAALAGNLPKLDVVLPTKSFRVAGVDDVENVDISVAADLLPEVSEDGGDGAESRSRGGSSSKSTRHRLDKSFKTLNSFVEGYDRSESEAEHTTVSSGAVKLSMGPLTDRSRHSLRLNDLPPLSPTESRQLYSLEGVGEYASSDGGDDSSDGHHSQMRRKSSEAMSVPMELLMPSVSKPPHGGGGDDASSVATATVDVGAAAFYQKKYFLAPAETWYGVGGFCGWVFFCGELIGLSLVASSSGNTNCPSTGSMLMILFLCDFFIMEPLYMAALYAHRFVASAEDDDLFSELHPVIGETREHLIPPPRRRPSELLGF